MFLTQCERPSSVPLQKTGKIIVLYILIFVFSDSELEDKKFILTTPYSDICFLNITDRLQPSGTTFFLCSVVILSDSYGCKTMHLWKQRFLSQSWQYIKKNFCLILHYFPSHLRPLLAFIFRKYSLLFQCFFYSVT